MNGGLTPCLITISPDSGARHVALTRQPWRGDDMLRADGWRRSHNLWFAPSHLPPVYFPPQMPLGCPLRGFFVVCLYGDRDFMLFGESERGAQVYLEQVLKWRRHGERWECPGHEESDPLRPSPFGYFAATSPK